MKRRAKIRVKRMAGFYNKFIFDRFNVLDIGCGNGVVGSELKKQLKRDFKLTGTDVLEYSPPYDFVFCKEKIKPFENNEFDVSMFNDVLHHIKISEQISIIKEALRISKVVLLYEVNNSLSAKIIDIIGNKTHDSNVELPLTMKSVEEWITIFRSLNVEIKYEIIPRSWDQLFLLKNYCFALIKPKPLKS